MFGCSTLPLSCWLFVIPRYLWTQIQKNSLTYHKLFQLIFKKTLKPVIILAATETNPPHLLPSSITEKTMDTSWKHAANPTKQETLRDNLKQPKTHM